MNVASNNTHVHVHVRVHVDVNLYLTTNLTTVRHNEFGLEWRPPGRSVNHPVGVVAVILACFH